MLPILFLLLSLLSLACSQPTFLRVGPSLVNPPTSWPAPREKANAEWISLTTNFYDGNAENPITLSNYGVIYGGQNNLGQLMNDVWASVDGMTWVWVAGYVGTSPHGRVPLSFPTRSDVAHCQDGAFVQYRAGGALSTTMFNDVWRTAGTLNKTWVRASATAPWAPRFLASMSSDLSTGSVYIAGGILAQSGTRPSANDVWQSTDLGATWTQRYAGSPSGPGPRGVAILIGGYGPQLVWMTGVNTATGVNYGDVWASSDAGSTWGALTAAAGFGARDDANGEVMGNGIAVVAAGFGEEGTTTTVLNDVWMSANGGWSWNRCVADAEWDDRRYLMTLADPLGRLWIFGGSNGTTNFNDIWVSTWSFYDSAATGARCSGAPGPSLPLFFPACGNGLKCYPTDPATVRTTLGSPTDPLGIFAWCPACPVPLPYNN